MFLCLFPFFLFKFQVTPNIVSQTARSNCYPAFVLILDATIIQQALTYLFYQSASIAEPFSVQMRIQRNAPVSWADTRPPTAAQAVLKPGAQESLQMLCIIHGHTRNICPNTHFPVPRVKNSVQPLNAWHGALFKRALTINLTYTLEASTIQEHLL